MVRYVRTGECSLTILQPTHSKRQQQYSAATVLQYQLYENFNGKNAGAETMMVSCAGVY